MLQALLQGPFVDQLQQRLSGLPGEVVQQLVHMISQLADSIGQHGQQVRGGEEGRELWLQTAPLRPTDTRGDRPSPCSICGRVLDMELLQFEAFCFKVSAARLSSTGGRSALGRGSKVLKLVAKG